MPKKPSVKSLYRGLIASSRMVWSKINDYYYGIETDDTSMELDPLRGYPYAKCGDKSQYKDSFAYRASGYHNIRRVIRYLAPGRDDVFCDIGCGKRRWVCLFARLKIRCSVGIELNASLCDLARRNAERLRHKRAPIEIRCEDAATADLSDGSIYLMNQPFGEETMRRVLSNIERSTISRPRKITVVSYRLSQTNREVLDSCEWLYLTGEMGTLTGCPIGLYTRQGLRP